MRKGFTLIEVMISVMIISVVIGAMLQIFSNNTHFFSQFKTKIDLAWSSSLIVYEKKIGFEDDDISLDETIKKFNVQDELRQGIKKIKANIIYQEIELIDSDEIGLGDTNETEEDESYTAREEEATTERIIFEIGKTSFKVDNESTSFLRLRVQ